MPIDFHFQDCKAILVLSPFHVKSAIASTGHYTSLFTTTDNGDYDKIYNTNKERENKTHINKLTKLSDQMSISNWPYEIYNNAF